MSKFSLSCNFLTLNGLTLELIIGRVNPELLASSGPNWDKTMSNWGLDFSSGPPQNTPIPINYNHPF